MSTITIARLSSIAMLCMLTDAGPTITASKQHIRQVATLRTARSAHTATTLRSGHVLIAGGMGGGEGSLASAELFDPRDNRVQQIGSMTEGQAVRTIEVDPKVAAALNRKEVEVPRMSGLTN